MPLTPTLSPLRSASRGEGADRVRGTSKRHQLVGKREGLFGIASYIF